MSKLGLKKDEVQIVPYDPRWVKEFLSEKRRLESLLGELAQNIEHIGSTSIPRMPAKPIVDIALGAKTIKEAKKITKLLEKAGYHHHVEFFRPDRHFMLSKRRPLKVNHRTTHHVHVIKYKGAKWKDFLSFRDFMLGNPAFAKRYIKIKKALAGKYANNREQYRLEKRKFVDSVREIIKGSRIST